MKKGVSGVALNHLAALGFILCILDQPLLGGILMFIAIYVEKDEWLGRQTMQALLLNLFVRLIDSSFVNLSYSIDPEWNSLYDAMWTLSIVMSVACFIVIVVFSLIAILNVLKGRDASVPILSGASYKLYGKIKPQYIQVRPQNYYQHPYYPGAQAPPPMQTAEPPVAPPVATPAQQQPVATPAAQPVAQPVTAPTQGTDAQQQGGQAQGYKPASQQLEDFSQFAKPGEGIAQPPVQPQSQTAGSPNGFPAGAPTGQPNGDSAINQGGQPNQ